MIYIQKRMMKKLLNANFCQCSSDGSQQALSRRMLDKLVAELEARFHHYQVVLGPHLMQFQVIINIYN